MTDDSRTRRSSSREHKGPRARLTRYRVGDLIVTEERPTVSRNTHQHISSEASSDPAVVVLNPDDEVTPESFVAWLDRRRGTEPLHSGVRAADTLGEARAAGEV